MTKSKILVIEDDQTVNDLLSLLSRSLKTKKA
jgi:hypothetical protein